MYQTRPGLHQRPNTVNANPYYPNIVAHRQKRQHHRQGIFNAGMIPTIKEKPRNRQRPKRGRQRFFNDAIRA